MSALLERPEITPFLNTWQSKPPEQVAEELASYSLETKRIPDPYYFLVGTDGVLLSPTAHCRIKDVVLRTHPAGESELQALSAIEKWANNNNEGAIAWVSPPYPGLYPTSKIIISEIQKEGETKKLFNRALILDIDEKKCLKFAQDLSNFSQNRPLLSCIEEIRATPLVLGQYWMQILQELIVDSDVWDMIKSGTDKKAKQEALLQAGGIYQVITNRNTPLQDSIRFVWGMLGEKSGSCPTNISATAFSIFSKYSLEIGKSSFIESDKYGSLEFDCPKCKRVNRRPKGELIPNCKHCKADVTC